MSKYLVIAYVLAGLQLSLLVLLMWTYYRIDEPLDLWAMVGFTVLYLSAISTGKNLGEIKASRKLSELSEAMIADYERMTDSYESYLTSGTALRNSMEAPAVIEAYEAEMKEWEE